MGANIDVGGILFVLVVTVIIGGGSIALGLRRRRIGPPPMSITWWILLLSMGAALLGLSDLQHLWWFSLFMFVAGISSWWELRRLIKKRLSE